MSELSSINPANKETLGSVVLSSAEEVKSKLKTARQAFAEWKNTSLAERLVLIEKFGNILYEQKEEVAKLITQEAGKPFIESLASEVFAVLETVVWLKRHAERILVKEQVELNPVFFTGKHSYNTFEPLGVIAVISPWNYPFSIPANSVLNALAAGNAVILKPSPKTPLVAEKIISLLYQAGFPQGIISIIHGDKEAATELILAGVNRIMFTGSTEGGRAIMRLAAEKLTPVTLELGGKHPGIVLDDINIDEVADNIVWCAFTNAGQACASLDRLYVEKNIFKELSTKIATIAKSLKIGNGLDQNIDMGPLIDEGQLIAVGNKLQTAVKNGAQVLAGGNIRSDLGGYFFEPTVISNVHDEMPIMQEEIFGPILPIMPVETAQEAINKANSAHLGLGASIWTKDLHKGEKLAEEIQAGMVWINDGLYSHVCPDAPWGGLKNSGFGRMHSRYELLELVNIKNIGVDHGGKRDWNFPYSPAKLGYARGGIGLLHAKQLTDKMSSLWEAVVSRGKIQD